MTRQEMYNLILEKNWNDEIMKEYKRPYSSCTNDVLAAFIAKRTYADVTGNKTTSSEQEKQKEKPKEKPKTQEELLKEINERVDAYKESTRDIRQKSEKLDEYTNLLGHVKSANSFIITSRRDCSNDDGLVDNSYIKLKFDDNEFVRELLMCFLTERINALLDSIDKTKRQLKAI